MPVRLFVGNLSYDATEAELREHFGTIGPVTYCYLPTDRDTGRPRGFAFVEFGEDGHAQDAIARLNNQVFKGRPLAVKEAQPREARSGGGPRYGGGPGGASSRPYSGGPRPGFGGGPGGAGPSSGGPQRRDREFGPDAPPRGKRKSQFNRSEQRGPKGPIRTKTDNRIYDAFGGDDEEDTNIEFDNFATSLDDEARENEE
jgi:cold-inducible RNA-binding protein